MAREVNDTPTPMTDVQRKGGYRQIDKKSGDVTVFCRPVKDDE